MNLNNRMNQRPQGEAKNVSSDEATSLLQYASENLQAFALANEIMTKEQRKLWRRRWAEIWKRPFRAVDITIEPGCN